MKANREVFSAESTFNQVLANSALHSTALRTQGKLYLETPAAIYFYQLAIGAVRSKLAQTDRPISQDLIATVSGFVCWAVSLKPPFKLHGIID